MKRIFKSNCLIIALIVWIKSGFKYSFSFSYKIARSVWPHFFVRVDNDTIIEFRGVDNNLSWLRALWFSGYLRKRKFKNKDKEHG